MRLAISMWTAGAMIGMWMSTMLMQTMLLVMAVVLVVTVMVPVLVMVVAMSRFMHSCMNRVLMIRREAYRRTPPRIAVDPTTYLNISTRARIRPAQQTQQQFRYKPLLVEDRAVTCPRTILPLLQKAN